MIKISHPLPSTSACSLAAVWCGIAMEAHLFPTQRKQNNRYWQRFLCFASSLPPHTTPSLISPPYSISLGPCQIYHIVFLTSLSPRTGALIFPHLPLLFTCFLLYGTTSLSPQLLPTHSISSIHERKRNCGRCTWWFWHVVYVPCR